MNINLVNDFISDLRIESVKLHLQLSSPSDDSQNNEVLGILIDGELDPSYSMSVIREAMVELREVEDLKGLHKIYDRWNKTRIKIQYEGYGYAREGAQRRGQAYAYIFIIRILKKRHIYENRTLGYK